MLQPAHKLFLGAVCIGFAPIFVKLIDLGPSAIGFFRCGIGGLLVLTICFGPRGNRPRLHWRDPSQRKAVLYLLVAGTVLALDFAIWHRSILHAGAGMATILANTQVFYVALFGAFFLQEKITFRFALSVLLAFLGVYFLVSFRSNLHPLPNYWWGIVFGLITGVLYATYLICLRRAKILTRAFSSSQIVALQSFIAATGLLFLSLANHELALPTLSSFGWLLLLALIPHVFGWLLITENLSHVPVSLAGLILLTQPVLATLLSAIFFREHLSSIQSFGVILTLAAIYLGSTRKARQTKMRAQ